MKRRSSAHWPFPSRRSLRRACGGSGGGGCGGCGGCGGGILVLLLCVLLSVRGVAGFDSVENGESVEKGSFFAESDSFSFPCTLAGPCSGGEENCQGPGSCGAVTSRSSLDWRATDTAAFRLSNGDLVQCSVANAAIEIHDKLSSDEKYVVDKLGSCNAPVVPDEWMRISSGMTASDLDEGRAQGTDSSLVDGSSIPNVELTPPLLDWGEVSLYSPSAKTLTVKNTHNQSNLHIYEPFSTDQQFYAFGFDSLLLEPGQSASISFIFLPRILGSSSAQLVLQTSFGGFVLQVRGLGLQSPYRIEPLVDMEIHFDGRLRRNLSLYNPLDDVLYVEEVSVWVSSLGDTNQSVHVVCGTNEFHHSSSIADAFLNDEGWFKVSNELGLIQLDIKPYNHWELPRHGTRGILEISLQSHFEGQVYGAICFKLRNSALDGMSMVVVPVELKVHGRTSYTDVVGLLSAYFEPVLPSSDRESIFSIFLRNEAIHSVKVLNIDETTETKKMFKIKYMRGLVLFPGTVTQIAMVNYKPTDPSVILPCGSSDCKVSITTNNSVEAMIQIPCQDFLLECSSDLHDSGIIASEISYIGSLPHHEKEISTPAKIVSSGSTVETSNYSKNLWEVAEELVLLNWRSQGTRTNLSVLKDHELQFPVVLIGSQASKWISVRNPSQKPVIVQLLLNSMKIIDQCKCPDEVSELNFYSRFTKIGTVARLGFSIPGSGITDALVHPSENALFGPVVFRPSNRCMWKSSALLRNNLSGVEWLPLVGFGGSHVLVLVEDAEPVWKLEFNFDSLLNPNLSSTNFSSNIGTARPLCNHQLSKELYAKNIGELPLEVKNLKVSGTDCGLDGFTISRCKGFLLEPGQSMRLLVSYQADFSTAVVNRNLELAMTTGIFLIPMRAEIPVDMLKFCRKSFFRLHWKASLLIVAALSTIFLLSIRILPNSFVPITQEYYVTVDNKIPTISKAGKASRLRHSTKVVRPAVNEDKPEAGFPKYSISQSTVLDGSKRATSKQGLETPKEITSSIPLLTTDNIEAIQNSTVSEAPQRGNLIVKVAKEKGRRKKRRAAGAGLAAKLEASSSQSGNSTPSSPLSPNAAYSKQLWSQSPEISETSFAAPSSEQKQQQGKQKHAVAAAATTVAPDAEKQRARALSIYYDKEQPSMTRKSPGLPSPVLPATTHGSPRAASSSILTSYSPIAPHVRAPGPKLSKEMPAKTEEKKKVAGKDFTYDIWGNHFLPENIWGITKEEVKTKMPDASEGDSQSFFSREPQTLVTMPSVQSVSPVLKLPSYDVACLDEMK